MCTVPAVSVEKTSYGTWRARWRDPDGKQRARTFRLKADANAHLIKVEGAKQRGEHIDPAGPKLTVTALADEWLTGAMNLRPGGRDTYRRDLDRHILPALGALRIGRLTPTAIDDFLAAELAAGLAPSSVHRHYRTLRRMLQVAVNKGRLGRNPCGPVTPPRVVPTEMRFLTVDQVEQLAANISKRYHAWVGVAAYGGLRWSETVGLRRGRVDGARIDVVEQLVRRQGVWGVEEPKTKAGRRAVTIPRFLADELEAHLDEWSLDGPTGLVFPNQNSDPLNSPSFTGNVFKPALRRAKLDPKTRIHDLRHTAVALAIAAGAHPKAIQVRMGHASITVTLDRYGHLFPEQDETIAAGLEQLRTKALASSEDQVRP